MVTSSSSSCYATNTDIPDPCSPLLHIVHRFWQVLWATSRIFTELLYVGSSRSPCPCLDMWGGPSVNITYELVPRFSSSVLHEYDKCQVFGYSLLSVRWAIRIVFDKTFWIQLCGADYRMMFFKVSAFIWPSAWRYIIVFHNWNIFHIFFVFNLQLDFFFIF